MIFRVVFKEKMKQCCPPKFYWVTRESNIVCESKEDILRKLTKGRHAVEIKDIQPID